MNAIGAVVAYPPGSSEPEAFRYPRSVEACSDPFEPWFALLEAPRSIHSIWRKSKASYKINENFPSIHRAGVDGYFALSSHTSLGVKQARNKVSTHLVWLPSSDFRGLPRRFGAFTVS